LIIIAIESHALREDAGSGPSLAPVTRTRVPTVQWHAGEKKAAGTVRKCSANHVPAGVIAAPMEGLSVIYGFAAIEIDAMQAKVLIEHEARRIAINVAVAASSAGP
jgi:hypothetical protein